ncbi:MAG: beta-lactamase family protein [Limnochordaceae bacterium]|nr:beta-lactamase family protein [Limnochordaceae bacterium]
MANIADFRRAFEVVKEYVDEGKIPGAVALIGYNGQEYGPVAYGWAQLVPEAQKRLMQPDTIFDMASCSKVMGTTTAVLMLLDQGRMRLDDPVQHFVPEWQGEGREKVRIRHLLTHSSGLPAWVDCFSKGQGPAEVVQQICTTPLEYATGEHVVYSCLGFILLGNIIERITGQRLDQFLVKHAFGPLQMRDTMYCPPEDLRGRIAATERKGPTDEDVLVGVVHDENARAMQGVSGNAGLFSTARDIGRFCRLYLQGGRLDGVQLLSPAVIEAATRSYTDGKEEDRGLGWLIRGDGVYSSAGDLMSPRAYGHTGFTGTSIWIDPTRDLYCVLLTNRVHPSRENDHHIRLRPLFHNAAVAACGR